MSARVRYYVLDASGEPQPEPDPIAYARWKEANHAACVVARTEVAPGCTVSTVFLGIDHAFRGGPPVLWESMIFGGALDGMQRRYISRANAISGHEILVANAQKMIPKVKAKARKRETKKQ
jgi:hypothetical protein